MIKFDKGFQINFDEEPCIFRSLNDQLNQSNFGLTLWEDFEELFINQSSGIVMSEDTSFLVMHYNNKYFFNDSHSYGPMGANRKEKGRACVIGSDNLDKFLRIC